MPSERSLKLAREAWDSGKRKGHIRPQWLLDAFAEILDRERGTHEDLGDGLDRLLTQHIDGPLSVESVVARFIQDSMESFSESVDQLNDLRKLTEANQCCAKE